MRCGRILCEKRDWWACARGARWSLPTWLLSIGLCVCIGFISSAVGQQPEREMVELQPVDETGQPLGRTELPETDIVARQGNFPSEPLPGDTVLSPNRMPTPGNQTGSSISVINSDEIDAISPRGGQTTVAEVLRGRLGVDVVQQGGPGSLTSVFMRGANSQQTKVLLDGMPLNDPSNAGRSFDFSTLTVDNVERIEILRGPQSMTYGSDAIGGVINIITKRGEGPLSIRASGLGGSFNTGQGSLGISGGDEVKYYAIDGAYFSTGGISQAAASNGNTEHDPFKVGNVSGRVGYNLGDSWNVDYVFRYIDSTAAIDDFDFFSGVPVDNLIRRNLLNNFSNRVQLSNWLVDGLVYQRVGFSLIDYDRVDTDPGFSDPRFKGQTRTVDYFVSFELTNNNTLTAGADYLAEESNSITTGDVGQNIKGVYLQDAVQWGNFNGTAGVRWDDASLAGPAQTYKVTGLYNIPVTASAIHSTIGTGFRQPSLAESQDPFIGDPNLRPETSKGWDAGWRQTIWDGVIVADATYYRNDFANLIIFDFDTFTLQNVGQSRSSGVELSILTQISPLWSLDALYTLNDTLNLDTNAELVRRPRDKVSLTLTRAVPNTKSTLALNMLYVSSALDSNNIRLDDYTLLRLAFNRQLTNTLTTTLRLDNITNTHYEQVRGYGTPGFAIYGGITGVF